MKLLANKRILLGVTGSIAAYKSAELTGRLRDAGAEVQVVMTRAGAEFITPLTLQALSGRPVYLHTMDVESETAMGHIQLARWADVLLIAPASADFIARLAHGQADDLLATLCLAAEVPLAVAPAMNRQMWQQSAIQANIQLLKARGFHLWGPADGPQACGERGPGRMLETPQLLALTAALFQSGCLQGRRLLITVGPTREAIDPVRFISNRSSGKMGFALAAAAVEAGALVSMVAGPVSLERPDRVQWVPVETAAQMYQEVMSRVAEQDIFIAAAAVADYRPQAASAQKIKKQAEEITLSLVRTADILAAVAALPAPPFTVGFAAETEALAKNARAKLREKSVDVIVANRVGQVGSGFDSDDNELQVFWGTGEVAFPHAAKTALARKLMGLIAERYDAKNSTENS